MPDFMKENYRIVQKAADREDPNFLKFMSEVDFIFDWIERRIPTSFTCNLIAKHEGDLWELGGTIERLGEKFDFIAKTTSVSDLYPSIKSKVLNWNAQRRLLN